MWQSLISNGHQATRSIHRLRPDTIFLQTTKVRPFGIASILCKDPAHTNGPNREALDPERSEVTKSGTDSEIAQHDSAWDPKNTAPERELEATELEHSVHGKKGSLNMSPANQDINAWKGPKEEGPVRNADKESHSSRGTPQKNRKIYVKEDGTHVSYR
ncbi:hypothetical protein N7462_010845 [Penicillium macrosclerotiorum]|uniref:uncharacterized protein n=1 Tax=Penicillium macrosclerotiorum TaxID=303699 RepID=UPI002548B625|nr:uncharacterized protein N7462_010845 [Penicillium macrosclerotiorum]KAJ5669775.1 hypothetical protein N7462_010845 [Penicillium macrosclerotiorum]